MSAYIYAGHRPTLLTDPSGLDPSFGGVTLNCKHNGYLCKLVYATGYKDGCKGQCVRRTLSVLAGRGIDFTYIYAAAVGKGHVVNAADGPKGPGLYFVGGGKNTKIEQPQPADSGLRSPLAQPAGPTPRARKTTRPRDPYQLWLATPKNRSGRALAQASGRVRVGNPDGSVQQWVELSLLAGLLEQGWTLA